MKWPYHLDKFIDCTIQVHRRHRDRGDGNRKEMEGRGIKMNIEDGFIVGLPELSTTRRRSTVGYTTVIAEGSVVLEFSLMTGPGLVAHNAC